MTFPDVNSYQKKESYIDTATFFGASLTFCAMKGGPLFDQFGIGCLLAAAANSLSITVVSKLLHINENTGYLLKICAVISALAVSSFALPWVVMSMAAKTTIFLNYEVGVVFAIGHLVTKISFYILYRIACAIKSHYSPTLPIEKVETTKLPQFLSNIINKFPKISLRSFKERIKVIDAGHIHWRKVGLIAFGILFFIATPLALYSLGSKNTEVDIQDRIKKSVVSFVKETCLSGNSSVPILPTAYPSQVATILQDTIGKKEVLEGSCSVNPLTFFNQTQFFAKKEVREFIPTQMKNITPIATKNLTRIFFPAVTLFSGIAGLILFGSRVRRELVPVENAHHLLGSSSSKRKKTPRVQD